MRTILHSDLNNFYASVECLLDPSLDAFPVVVCGKKEDRHGIVLAKNMIAKNGKRTLLSTRIAPMATELLSFVWV